MSLSRMASVDYLIDHVAAGDGRGSDPSASPLTRYYTAEGYPPGTWLGSGIAALGAAGMAGNVWAAAGSSGKLSSRAKKSFFIFNGWGRKQQRYGD